MPPNDSSEFAEGEVKGLRVNEEEEPNEPNEVGASEEAVPKGVLLDSDASWPRVDL